jgi:hypothetical protein
LVLGFVALDDYMYKPGECSFRSNECTFDDGSLCSWTNAVGNQFDWLVRKGPTPSFDTGPDVDHSMLNYLSKFVLNKYIRF